MASAKSLLVGIFLLSCVYTSFCYEFYGNYTTSVTIPNDGTAVTDAQIVVGTAGNFDGDITVVVYVKIDHQHVSELEVSLETPNGGTWTILRGTVNPYCTGDHNIDAEFSGHASVPHHNPFERCDTTHVPFVYGQIRAAQASKFTPPSGAIAGTYKLRVRDLNSADGISGSIVSFGLHISDDVDADGVTNEDDICPLNYDPKVGGTQYQADENQNGVGNECECFYRNFHVTEGDLKICYYLDNWGKDSKHYKGQNKQRGEWVSLIMPNRNLGEFQPGDYSHKNTWLDCDCVSWPILP